MELQYRNRRSQPKQTPSYDLGKMNREPKVRFPVGSEVRLFKPGVQGTVIAVEDEPGMNGEYWHTIRTAH